MRNHRSPRTGALELGKAPHLFRHDVLEYTAEAESNLTGLPLSDVLVERDRARGLREETGHA